VSLQPFAGASAFTQAEPLASGEAIYARLLANTNITLASGTLVLSYWTAATSGTATSVSTATVSTAAAGLTYAAIGIYSVGVTGNLTLLSSTGNRTGNIWLSTFAIDTQTLSPGFARVAGTRYALGVLAVGTTPPQLQAAGTLFAFEEPQFSPLNFANVTGQATLPSSVAAASINAFIAAGAEAIISP
jgi:hypothetical protein